MTRILGITRALKHPAAITVLLAQAVFAVIWLAAWTGSLEWAELLVYDSVLAEQAGLTPKDQQPVVLVGANDADVDALNWPLTDQQLADVLGKILAGKPKAIGVDLYRAEPREPGADKLTAILTDNDNVYMAYKFADQEGRGIPAPEAAQKSGQIGFTDLVLDPGGIVRRALLFLTDQGGQSGTGLALQLATRALGDAGVCLQSDGTAANNLALGPCPPENAAAGAPPPPRDKLVVIPPFEETDGGYVNADARGYQVMLDYRAGFHPFPMVSFGDLLSGRAPAERFRDKIVIVGVAAESVKDFFFTPYSRTAVDNQTSYGMEIHAHLVSELLRMGAGRAKPITPLPDWREGVWLWLWCMLGAMMGFRIRSPWALTARSVAGVVAIFVVGYVALDGFLWMPVAAPAFGWLLAAAIVTSFMSYHESQNRTTLMNLFSRHVSADVAEELWEQRTAFMDGNRPRPQRLDATVLFTDIKGFSTVSESLDAATLMDWLNEYMNAMSAVISLHGGVIDKFIGDAIMVVFGIPKKRETEAEIAADAVRAVMCAQAMGVELSKLNALWAGQGKPVIGMRIGIHTGSVVAGALGGAERLNYTVIGDAVNTAARLESFDKAVVDPEDPEAACRILISETTRAHLGGRFVTLRIGEVPLKGKQQRVEVHLVRATPAANAETK